MSCFRMKGFQTRAWRVFLPYDERLDSDFRLYNKGSTFLAEGCFGECNRQVVAEDVLESH